MSTSRTKQNTLPPKYRKILEKQVIDEQQPGTILRDFETLLTFVQEEAPLKVTKTAALLPMKYLPQVNERLCHPIKLDMKRPGHKAFPNVAGLYLLLRPSGLAYIEGGGAKQRLVIDEGMLESWQQLNPTERYFSLLDTWVIRALPEIIGERKGGIFGNLLYTWSTFFERIPESGKHIEGDKEEARMFKYFPGGPALCLLEMFGFITIHDADPEPGQGWRILSVEKTPLGEAILTVLVSDEDEIYTLEDILLFQEKPIEATFGMLQPKFQPFFPEWQNNLTLSTPEIQEGTYIVKASLGNIWRRIAIPGNLDFDWLSSAILNAFRFDHDHLYSFIYKNRFGLETRINHPYLEEPLFADKVAVQDVLRQPGMSMIFLYDFGDNWEFTVELERIDPVDPALEKPKVLKKHGKSPEQYAYW